ncbi:hypothetical protein FRACYDRAFT_239427 [Fragilariopsis cylindrus CCMP1102]|uniref:SAP domain-containing protein n=1 Tax=Fragilariopsis cylindrus CCMP1102 TaxID=635003 RepID=A0A1E7FFB4_9STRA|nr:hypothetical protein FRACYDRAFT_239427 [Fragilariopsis cylindrus CCMP1102]|eukprot:OEU16834.1 hypothetical protein FRACYDRAFT_239427 [Fragilariopsis cylindrus CCMP1102]
MLYQHRRVEATNRLSNSAMKDSSLIKPIFGAAGKMGKVVSAPALASSKFKGTFKADLNATRSWGPSNLSKPNNILKLHDPLEEEGAAGALARLLGRVTIQSVETSKPKLKAIARAAISTGNDDRKEVINLLQQRIEVLEDENTKLKQWKEQRTAADSLLSQYGVEELKAMARQNNLPVGGTKIQLLMLLLKNQILIPM